MQNPRGQVVSVGEDRFERSVIVEVDSVVACERCASGKGCGAGLLGSQSGDRRVQATVPQNMNVRIGDLVSIVLEPQNVLRAALIVYGYPLLGGILAAIGAFLAGFSEIAAACAALGGLVAGIWAARIRLQDTRCLREFTPKVVDMLSSAGD